MAVGYHKINTSAARSKLRGKCQLPAASEVRCIPAGTPISAPLYGDGVTLEGFVSKVDKVRCRFGDGELVLSGREVLLMLPLATPPDKE